MMQLSFHFAHCKFIAILTHSFISTFRATRTGRSQSATFQRLENAINSQAFKMPEERDLEKASCSIGYTFFLVHFWLSVRTVTQLSVFLLE